MPVLLPLKWSIAGRNGEKIYQSKNVANLKEKKVLRFDLPPLEVMGGGEHISNGLKKEKMQCQKIMVLDSNPPILPNLLFQNGIGPPKLHFNLCLTAVICDL